MFVLSVLVQFRMVSILGSVILCFWILFMVFVGRLFIVVAFLLDLLNFGSVYCCTPVLLVFVAPLLLLICCVYWIWLRLLFAALVLDLLLE